MVGEEVAVEEEGEEVAEVEEIKAEVCTRAKRLNLKATMRAKVSVIYSSLYNLLWPLHA